MRKIKDTEINRGMDLLKITLSTVNTSSKGLADQQGCQDGENQKFHGECCGKNHVSV